MGTLLLVSAAALFFLHLVSETLAIFVKYNFSSLGRHMTGVSLSNMIATLSRGFVALFGVCIAIVIESGSSGIVPYVSMFAAASLLGSICSLMLSKVKIRPEFIDDSGGVRWIEFRRATSMLSENRDESSVMVRGVTAIALGTQFVSTVIAYGVCFLIPERRLLIISLVPFVSTVGSLVAIVWVEPRLAMMIDGDNAKGYAASREFLRARAASFAFCAMLLLALPWIVPTSWT